MRGYFTAEFKIPAVVNAQTLALIEAPADGPIELVRAGVSMLPPAGVVFQGQISIADVLYLAASPSGYSTQIPRAHEPGDAGRNNARVLGASAGPTEPTYAATLAWAEGDSSNGGYSLLPIQADERLMVGAGSTIGLYLATVPPSATDVIALLTWREICGSLPGVAPPTPPTSPTIFGKATGTGSTSVNITYPASIAAGDFAVLLVSTAGFPVNTPTGYTVRPAFATTAADVGVASFTKPMVGTEGGTTLTVTSTGADQLLCTLYIVRGANATTPYNAGATSSGNGGAVSITTTAAGCLLLGCWSLFNAASTFTQPPGWTADGNLTSASDKGAFAHGTQAVAGANSLAISTSASEYAGVVLAISP